MEEPPKRKKKCPHCGHYILVRGGKAVTEDEAFIMDWLVRLEPFGVSRRDFDRNRQELSRQFGAEAGIEDTVWRILNGLVAHGYSVYWEMAHLARQEGKDPKPYLSEASRLQLTECKRDGLATVRVQTCNDDFVCPACKALYHKKFTVADALSQMPIPTLCQAKAGCRCWYSPEVRS
ncbi:MAG TPA: hypothetical protein VJ256_05805 [Dehalococcoidia bacterium]|nr:hypothetical protein [Dehalococcoidia bacterium]HLB29054.1 hypothetical protein [Dehalococcoidia bacterium]